MRPSTLLLPVLACTLVAVAPLAGQSKSSLTTDPGALDVESILPKPVKLTVIGDAVIYYQSDMQRVLGSMAAGATVQLVAITDTAWKVRGRARHGDVAGWMKTADLKSPDPKLPEKLKAYVERQRLVEELIQKHQIAVGMTTSEVKASLGQPARKSTHVTKDGREESYEYSVYKNVPKIVTGRDQQGNLVQNVIYVKVETGRLTVNFSGGHVSEIQETQGETPVAGGAVKIVPAPIVIF